MPAEHVQQLGQRFTVCSPDSRAVPCMLRCTCSAAGAGDRHALARSSPRCAARVACSACSAARAERDHPALAHRAIDVVQEQHVPAAHEKWRDKTQVGVRSPPRPPPPKRATPCSQCRYSTRGRCVGTPFPCGAHTAGRTTLYACRSLPLPPSPPGPGPHATLPTRRWGCRGRCPATALPPRDRTHHPARLTCRGARCCSRPGGGCCRRGSAGSACRPRPSGCPPQP